MEMQADNFAEHPKKPLNDGEKSFRCNQCNYTCDRPGKLKSHMLVHSGEKSFACTQCDYSANQTSHLKNHMMIHSGEKPFSSKQCHYSFTRSSHFKSHMLIHSGEKLYSCSARIVASPAQQLVISKITSVPIQEKNRFIVINATIKAP